MKFQMQIFVAEKYLPGLSHGRESCLALKQMSDHKVEKIAGGRIATAAPIHRRRCLCRTAQIRQYL